MAEIINTVNMKESLTVGEDKNFEMVKKKKRDDEKDFPLKEVDQSQVCSTHTIVPNKREVQPKDVKKFITRMKNKLLGKKTETKSKSGGGGGKKMEKSKAGVGLGKRVETKSKSGSEGKKEEKTKEV